MSAVLARALAADAQASTGARHLADASFRFDAEAPAPPPVRPRTDTPWTLAETLRELRLRGTTVTPTTRGLRVAHAHRVPALAAAVATHAEAVEQWLALGRPAPAGDWDDETALQMAWATRRLRDETRVLELRPGVSVTDWARFRDSLHGRYGQGPDAPCAASLLRDLADLAVAARPALRVVARQKTAKAA